MAGAPRLPGYQASSTARTSPAHGVVSGPPFSSTTTVLRCAAATWRIRSSWPFGSARSGRSSNSPRHSFAKTIATSESRASAAAAPGSEPSAKRTSAPGASSRIASSGDDGAQIGQRLPPGPSGSQLGGTAGPPGGVTWDEPPPDSTPTSACSPMTAIEPTDRLSGSIRSRFFSSTIERRAMRSVTRAPAATSIEPGPAGGSS